jgi:hypothetical protein
MPRINASRVFTAGLAAGLVIIVVNIAAQSAFGGRLRRDMDAWMPGAADRMELSGAVLTVGVLMKLVIGIVLVWLYAAARPRFGPGPKTAGFIALAAWVLGAIFLSDFPMTGMMSWSTYAILVAAQLLGFLAAAMSGASLYRE